MTQSDRSNSLRDQMERLGHDQENLIAWVLIQKSRDPGIIRAMVEDLVNEALALGAELGDEVITFER